MSFTSADIRNIAVIGHNGTGKTTLFEQLMLSGGVISKAETVDSGKTVSDYTDEEISRQISMYMSHGSFSYKDKTLNFFDTPGTSDFIGEVISAFRASESALLIVDGRDGVQIETIKLWRRMAERNLPRLIFINKYDKERASFQAVFDDLKEKFETTFVPVVIPMGEGPEFKGIINLIENKAYPVDSAKPVDIPEAFQDTVEELRLELIEAVAEGEDELMEKYFEEGTLDIEDIRRGLLAGFQDNKIVPVLGRAAELNSGNISLLNFIANNAPSPAGKKESAVKGEEETLEIDISFDADPAVFVYKTSIDQFSGKLSYFKVVTDKVDTDTELVNLTVDKKEKISKLYKSVGKKLIEVKELIAGDVGVITKTASVSTNDTLSVQDKGWKFAPLKLPQPIFSLTVAAGDKKSEDKMNDALHRIVEQDLTFQIQFNSETKENVISGMGELHINSILDKIQEKQKITIHTKTPKVAYRETIQKTSGAEYTHKKQSGGHGQYGRVVIDIKPLPRGEQFSFENVIKGGAISKGYMPGIEKGLIEAMEEGYLAGYPLVDIGVQVVDGKEHPVDSSEMSFKLAAKGALKAALAKASVVLLEPIMRLHVFIEGTYLGDILSDLSSKRGRVFGQEDLGGGIMMVDAEVPQSEMLRYAIDLKSLTSGTGSFEMEFDHYEAITGKIADDVIQAAKETEES